MSSRSATPAASHAPAYIVISSDGNSDSETARKRDPEFVLEQAMKREGEVSSSDGVLMRGCSGGGAQVPKPPPVSSEFHFSSQVQSLFLHSPAYIIFSCVLTCVHVEKKLRYFALVAERNQNIMSPKRMLYGRGMLNFIPSHFHFHVCACACVWYIRTLLLLAGTLYMFMQLARFS